MTTPLTSDINSHTISGTLNKDAEFRPLSHDSEPTHYRFRFRMGTRKVYRQGKDVRSRMTWSSVKLDVPAAGLDFYRSMLTAGSRVLVVGEQLVDEEDGEGGRRYWHFIRATTVQLIQAPQVDEPEPAHESESAQDEEPTHDHDHAPRYQRDRPKPEKSLPPAPRNTRQYPERSIDPPRNNNRPQRTNAPRAHRETPVGVDSTHFDPVNW